MNIRCHTNLSYRWSVFGATIFALALWVPPVSAQLGRSRIEHERSQRNAEQMREVEIKRLEGALNNKKPTPDTTPSLPFLQIREDFRQLQIVHNEMMATTFSVPATGPLDYRHISKATAEINKRAVRLKAMLQLPKPQVEQAHSLKEVTSDAQLKVSLLTLDNHIMKFVKNPSFIQTGVVDAQESSKASQDLIHIIELARHIRQSSARLGGTKSQ